MNLYFFCTKLSLFILTLCPVNENNNIFFVEKNCRFVVTTMVKLSDEFIISVLPLIKYVNKLINQFIKILRCTAPDWHYIPDIGKN